MKDLEKSIVASLDGRDKKLLPYFPYLMQDLWEIGASPEVIAELIKKHGLDKKKKILDLGCGKGAVSVKLAREFDFSIHGVDAMPEFIVEAYQYAQKYKVEKLCKFEV